MPRIACTLEGFETCFVDVTDIWSRPEWTRLVDGGNEEFWALWRAKVRGVALVTLDGTEVTDPAAVDDALMDRLDLRLLGFVGAAMQEACLQLRGLGNVSGRASSASNVKR